MNKQLKKGDIVRVIISASKMNLKETENQFDENFEYRIDISYHLNNEKESFIDTSYSIGSDFANEIFLDDELLTDVEMQMKEYGVKKYSILKTNVNTIEGYGKQQIKIIEMV
ncbi:MAG: hypothetical protein IJY61_06255 [Candidatus Gastranaerophilales bacterium]|nr:hypothetical protein [Candidatus Gastranaerophilales bacterium]